MLIGAKGGGGSEFVQKPDNLRSEDTFEGLLGLCAGPIKGPVRGMKSVRLNGTPIEDETGKANFKDFTAIFADGDPLKYPQIATLKLGSAGAPDQVNLQIRNLNSAGTPGDWITHTLNNTGAEAVDLRFIVQQLYKQSKKGIFEETLTLDIQMKPVGTTTWINPFSSNGNPSLNYDENGYDNSGKSGNLRFFLSHQVYTDSTSGSSGTSLKVTGKTTSAYVKELRVQVPNEGVYANKGWDIRVRLVEPESVDDDPNFEKRTVTWESATAVFSGEVGNNEDWRAFSWLQLYGKASDNFNGLPDVNGVYDTKIVSVPPLAVFDPETRVYSGAVWDGAWEKAYTNDPAWIINDAISDSISGLAAFVPGAYLNKWDALELSKWCSELVPDGAGGTHPRYALNLFVDQPQKSDEFIRYLAGAVGATAWDNGGGEWRLKVDKPQTAADIFTSETIEGEFNYSHTDVDTRHNDVTVVFLNEEFDYREDRVRVVDQANIDKYGRKPTKVVGIGCTNRQQALRWAVLRLRTNINEVRAVSFTTNRRGKLLERFDHILIADGTLNQDGEGNSIRSTGRIVGMTTNLLPQGNNLTDAIWSKINGATVVRNVGQGFGGMDSFTVGDATTSYNTFLLQAGVTIPAGTTTLSGYIKKDPAATACVMLRFPGDIRLIVNPVTGQFSSFRPASQGITIDNVIVTDTGDGFWRGAITVSLINPFSGNVTLYPAASDLAAAPSVSLSPTSMGSATLCGVQIEEGSVATDFTPATAIRLRDTVRLEVGVAYDLHITAPNPNYDPDPTGEPADPTWAQPTITTTRTVTNTAGQRGDVTELFLDAPLPVDVAENANIALEAVGLPAIPKTFRIVDVAYGDDGERAVINAIEVDTAKWAAADAATDDNIALVLADVPPPPIAPVEGVLSVGVFPGEYDTGRVLYAHWDRPLYKYADGYRLERRHNNGPWLDLGHTRQEVFELANPPYGLHEFRIYTVNVKGLKSLPLEASLDVEAILDSPLTGYLTNESHTVAADADGTGFSLVDAGGDFVVLTSVGRVTTGITYEVVSEVGCDATIAADGTYSILALSADQATVVFRATVDGFALPVEKTYTLSKSRAGSDGTDGSDAKLLFVISNRQTMAYDADGTPNPANQTITFTAQKQNTTNPVTWTVTDLNGVLVDATSVLSATTGNSVTMTEAQFAAARAGTNGVIVKGSLTDGATLTDQISVVKVASGADGLPGDPGPGGPVIALNADDLSFDYIDGIPFDAGQLITVTAEKQNTSEAIIWSVAPNVTLGAPSADERTLSITDFGQNMAVVITATGADSGASASVTLIRNMQTTPNDSIIPDSNWTSGRLGSGRTWDSLGEMTAVNLV